MVKSYKTCEICNIRPANGLVGRICSICQRKLRFEQLPVEQQQAEYAVAVPERYWEAKLEDLKPSIQTAFRKRIENGVLLWGTPGSGKTYAMSALIKKQIAEGYIVNRIHYEILCLKLRDTFNTTNTEWGIIEPLLNCDKLFIEDLGVTKSIGVKETDFSLRTFLVLLDIRMEHLRPTFITSNKSVENLEKSFDERIGDRLRIFDIFQMKEKSRR